MFERVKELEVQLEEAKKRMKTEGHAKASKSLITTTNKRL